MSSANTRRSRPEALRDARSSTWRDIHERPAVTARAARRTGVTASSARSHERRRPFGRVDRRFFARAPRASRLAPRLGARAHPRRVRIRARGDVATPPVVVLDRQDASQGPVRVRRR
jgi:hypothetical protein